MLGSTEKSKSSMDQLSISVGFPGEPTGVVFSVVSYPAVCISTWLCSFILRLLSCDLNSFRTLSCVQNEIEDDYSFKLRGMSIRARLPTFVPAKCLTHIKSIEP